MKTYKIDITFKIEDTDSSITSDIEEHGIEAVEHNLSLSFQDPNFGTVNAKITEVKN